MRIPHTPEILLALRSPTPEEPLRILVSGCLAGMGCGVNGTDYGLGVVLRDLLSVGAVRAFPYCPEEVGLGTPRTLPDIHGGDGHDVLDGRARVLDEHGTDLTDGMVAGARGMLAFALSNRVELAILTDMSAACGTQVISDGCRLVEHRRFRAGVGVAAALLLRNAIAVVSQRDPRSIGILREKIEPGFRHDPVAVDYHESSWYVRQFGAAGAPPQSET